MHQIAYRTGSSFIEEFFDSTIYKDILARNDETGMYVVKTASDSVYLLNESKESVTELHFQEEIDLAIASVSA